MLASAAAPGALSPGGRPTQGGKSLMGLASTLSKPEAPPARAQRATKGDWKDKADIPKKPDAREGKRPGKVAGGDGMDVDPSPNSPPPGAGGVNGGTLIEGTQSKAGRIRRLPSHLKEQPEEDQHRVGGRADEPDEPPALVAPPAEAEGAEPPGEEDERHEHEEGDREPHGGGRREAGASEAPALADPAAVCHEGGADARRGLQRAGD